MTPEEHAIYAWEGRLIIQIDRLAAVQKRLTKQLVTGRVQSEVAGAYMDLRNIATQIESIAKDDLSAWAKYRPDGLTDDELAEYVIQSKGIIVP